MTHFISPDGLPQSLLEVRLACSMPLIQAKRRLLNRGSSGSRGESPCSAKGLNEVKGHLFLVEWVTARWMMPPLFWLAPRHRRVVPQAVSSQLYGHLS